MHFLYWTGFLELFLMCFVFVQDSMLPSKVRSRTRRDHRLSLIAHTKSSRWTFSFFRFEHNFYSERRITIFIFTLYFALKIVDWTPSPTLFGIFPLSAQRIVLHSKPVVAGIATMLALEIVVDITSLCKFSLTVIPLLETLLVQLFVVVASVVNNKHIPSNDILNSLKDDSVVLIVKNEVWFFTPLFTMRIYHHRWMNWVLVERMRWSPLIVLVEEKCVTGPLFSFVGRELLHTSNDEYHVTRLTSELRASADRPPEFRPHTANFAERSCTMSSAICTQN